MRLTAHEAPPRRLPRSFYLLLTGQTVSLAGSQVTLLALPLIAIELHHVGPFETGLLLACGRVPYLLLGLLAGVLVDRLAHRPLLMIANATMALTLATVPVAATVTGYVGMLHLYAVATLVGAATVIADVAFLACVPTVVRLSQLPHAQSQLELGQSAALVLGLPLAGWLIATFSPPLAILADTASFVLVMVLLPHVEIMRPAVARVHAPVDRSLHNVHPAAGRAGGFMLDGLIGRVCQEAAEGALFVLRTSRLRAVTFATATLIFCFSAYSAVFLLYLTNGLRLSATVTGTVTGIAAAGGVAGSLLARPVARVLGLGRTLVAALATTAVGAVLTPLLTSPSNPAFQASGWMATGLSQFVLWTGQQIYNVHQVPIRYALAPAELHGRVNASIRTIVWSLAPLGALFGGACGTWLGLRMTLLLSGALIAAAAGWIVTSPLWAVRTPQLAEAHTATALSSTVSVSR